MNARTVKRVMKDEALLMENAKRNAIVLGGDPAKAEASIRARMARPVARGNINAGLWFFVFMPWYLKDADELERAVDGKPTWGRAADIARVWDVSARTLRRRARLPYGQSGDITAIRLGRTLLIRVPEIAGKYAPRRMPVPHRLRFLAKIAESKFSSGR